MALYDRIGDGYGETRRDDPRIAAAIRGALGDARTIVNVGAGAGSYEPTERWVVAVEPSRVQIAQRETGSAHVVRAVAESLPFADDAFDAALAILTMHHWNDWRRGVREMRRVARDRIVIFTWDPDRVGAFWMNTHYLPEAGVKDAARFPRIAELREALGGAEVIDVPTPFDCADGFYGAYWRRPAAYLRTEVHRGISVLRQLPRSVVSRAMQALRADLDSGEWERLFCDVSNRESLDLGYRVVLASKNR
jgi:SAM-dependent methyltransferase